MPRPPTTAFNTLRLAVLCLLAGPMSATAELTYTTGLDVWLDASDIDGAANATLTDGDPIATWKNKGTTGVNDATPVGGAGGFGSSTFLAAGGPGTRGAVTVTNALYQFGQEFVDSGNVTMYFVVYRSSTASAQGTLFTDYGTIGNETMTVRTGMDSVTGIRDADGDVTWVNDGAIEADQKWAILFFSANAATGTVTYGELGNLSSTTNPAHNPATTFEGTFAGPVTLFGFHDGNNGHDFNGEASEVLIYDHLLDDVAKAQVESYLLSKNSPPPPVDFRVTEIVRHPDGSVSLTWNSDPTPGTFYTVLYSDNLETPSTNWPDAQDGVATEGTTTSFTIPAAVLPQAATTLFFRIRLN